MRNNDEQNVPARSRDGVRLMRRLMNSTDRRCLQGTAWLPPKTGNVASGRAVIFSQSWSEDLARTSPPTPSA